MLRRWARALPYLSIVSYIIMTIVKKRTGPEIFQLKRKHLLVSKLVFRLKKGMRNRKNREVLQEGYATLKVAKSVKVLAKVTSQERKR